MDGFIEVLKDNTIYQVITGSTAYGLTSENSDVDQKAIVILPAFYTFRLTKEWETETFHNPDIEFHSLKKAMNLLQSQNPTVLETLFVPEQFIVKQTKYGRMLRENRQLFLSQNCYYAFGGYAKDQLMRIKNGLDKTTKDDHNNHLEYTIDRMLQQMRNKYPSLDDGVLTFNQVYFDNNDKQNVDLTVNFNPIPLTQLNGFVSELASLLKSYNKVNNRNRKPLDKLSKHAMHLVRLLLMGIELLESGQLVVYRKEDRDFLLAIRNEQYSWDELFKITATLFDKLDQARQKSVLPENIDPAKINELYFELMKQYYRLR